MTFDEWNAEPYARTFEDAWKAGAASRDAEVAKLKREDFREMREMLRTMQAGELTVSRGIEILNIWWAGNWNDSMLPPVRQGLIEEDSMPVEIIDRLKQERDQLRAQINVLREALSSAESALDESRDYPVTYDEVITALSSTPEQSLAEYRNKVIEECAKRAEAYAYMSQNFNALAEELRAMKEQP